MAIKFPSPVADGYSFTAENGVVYTYDSSGGGGWYAYHPDGLNDVYVNIDGDTMTGDLTVPSLNEGPLAGFRNQIINGDFRVWQRGSGPTAPNATGTSYLADRWTVRGTGGSGGTPTVQFQWGPNKEYSMHRYNATGLTSGSYVEQRIEAHSVRPLTNKQLTVSVYSSHPVAISLYYYDSASALQTIDVEQNMTSEGNNRYSHTFTMPNATVAAFGEDTGLIVRFHYNNAENPLANGSYDIWNAQLEPGSQPTPFEHRPIGTELSLCQRYFQKAENIRTIGLIRSQNASTTGQCFAYLPFPVQMRATPTVASLGTWDTTAGNETCVPDAPSVYGVRIRTAATNKPGGTIVSGHGGGYTADAEL